MFELTEKQKEIIKNLLEFVFDPNSPQAFIVEGFSGCGKTTMIQYFLKAYEAKLALQRKLNKNSPTNLHLPPEIVLTATTHKAVRALESKLAENVPYKLTTIHSFLNLVVKPNYLDGGVRLCKSRNFNVLYNKILIIDEASMIDAHLLKYIEEAMDAESCKIIYIGDPKQLLAVGRQNALVFEQPNIPKNALTEVLRQSGDTNTILDFGEQMRNLLDKEEFKIPQIQDSQNIILCSGEEFKQKIIQTFTQGDLNPESARILARTNKKVKAYNKFVRSLFTETSVYQKGEVLVSNQPLLTMDSPQKIILRNDEIVIVDYVDTDIPQEVAGVLCYYVISTNGEHILVPYDHKQYQAFLKHYQRQKEWPEYFLLKQSVSDLRPLYSSTVHKAQGSTFDDVFIDLSDIGTSNNIREIVRLLYVGFTRAKNNVYVYGQLPNWCIENG